jgi:hypothetical protein
MNGPGQTTRKERVDAVVAGLVSTLVDCELASAKSKHLRHEGHSFDLTVAVKSLKDFFPAADFHQVAYVELGSGLHNVRSIPYRFPAIFSIDYFAGLLT